MKKEEIAKIFDLSLVSSDAYDYIGLAGQDYLKLQEANIPLPQGFILTTKVFDDFLILNDLVGYITERLSEIQIKSSLIERNSKAIRSKIMEGKMPDYLENSVPGYLKKFSGLSKVSVDMQACLFNEDLEKSLEDEVVYLSGVSDIDNIYQNIRLLWSKLFEVSSLKKREIAKYEGPLSMAIMIFKSPIVEISGKASSNSLGREKLVELEAVMGDIELLKKDQFNGDRYVVDTQVPAVVEKNIVEQKKMYVTSFGSKGLKKEKLTISKPWRKNPKMSDSQATFMGLITCSIKELFQTDIEIEFGIEMGKPVVTYIKKVGNSVSASRQEKEASKGTSHFEILKNKIGNLENLNNDPAEEKEVIKNKTVDFDKPIVQAQVVPEIPTSLPKKSIKPMSEYVDEVKQEIKPLRKKIDANKIKVEEEINTGIDVFVSDYEAEANIKYSKNIAGYVSLSGDDFIAINNRALSDLAKNPKDFVTNLVDYLIANLENTAEPAIYEFISNAYLQDGPGMGAYKIIKDSTIFQYELEAIRKVRNSMQKKNLWVSVPYIRSTAEFLEVKKIISINRLRRSPTFRVYASIDNASSALIIEDLIEAMADGFVFNLDNMYKNILGGFDEGNLPLDGMKKLLTSSLKIVNQYKSKSIAKALDTKRYFNIQELIEFGFTAISAPLSQVIEYKKEIQKLETNKLKRK